LVAGSIPVSRSILRSLREPDGRPAFVNVAVGGKTVWGLARQARSRPVGRGASAKKSGAKADVAQLAEHVLGKDEVTSSILVIGSILR
jgi:hypothetical protein